VAHNLEAKLNLDGGKGRGPAIYLLYDLNSAESTIVLLKILYRNNIQTIKTRFKVLL
jgi:hypothetical protein